jgi:hypothetical protein
MAKQSSNDRPNRRRWARLSVYYPVAITVPSNQGSRTLKARGTELSEGGMGVFAPVELRVGDDVQLEFTLPYSPRKMVARATVRNLNRYYYNLEFVAETAVEQLELTLLRQAVSSLRGRLEGVSVRAQVISSPSWKRA